MGGDSATRLRSNAAPHHTLYFLIELIIISTPSIAETLSTPPIEAATDAITVTLAPKLKPTGKFVQHNIQKKGTNGTFTNLHSSACPPYSTQGNLPKR